jgi:Bacteriophage KPP10, Structural protein ORF10
MKIFDPSQFNIVLGGVTMQGFSESAMAKFEFDGESMSDVVGVDGEVSRSQNMDRRAKVTVSLMQTSSTNDLLSAMYLAGRASQNGSDVVAFRMEDLNGRLVIGGAEAWIQDTPKPSYGKSASEYEWVIRVANCDAFFGGN